MLVAHYADYHFCPIRVSLEGEWNWVTTQERSQRRKFLWDPRLLLSENHTAHEKNPPEGSDAEVSEIERALRRCKLQEGGGGAGGGEEEAGDGVY